MQRHDAANTSFVPDTLAFPLKLSWRKRVGPGQSFQSSPILASGGVVCLGNDNGIALYDVATGRMKARVLDAKALYLKEETLILLTGGSASTPAEVRRYNWKTKRQIWTCSLGGKVDSLWGSVESKGCVYVSCTLSEVKPSVPSAAPVVPGCHLIAINFETGAITGRVIGSRRRDEGTLPAGVEVEAGWGDGPPAVDDEFVCWGISHGLYFFRPGTLIPAARTIYDGGNFFPILTDTHILTQGWLHHVNGLYRDRTGAAWSFSAYRGTAHSLAQTTSGKMILAESLNQPLGLAGIALDTGQIQWQVPLFAGSVAGAKNIFVVSGWHQTEANKKKPGQLVPLAQATGGFYAFDTTTGKRLWEYTRPGMRVQSVIISEGCVYGRTVDGYLYRFISRHFTPSPKRFP